MKNFKSNISVRNMWYSEHISVIHNIQKFVLFLYGIPQLKLQWKQVYFLLELNMADLPVKKI